MTDIARRLAAADKAWTTAQGMWRHWRRQDLVSLAFDRHFDDLESAGLASWSVTFTSVDDDADDDPVMEAVHRVWFDRPGRRARVETVRRRGEEWGPDLVVWDGDTFWAQYGGRVLTNHGDPDHRHGGDEVRALLEPSYVPVLYELAEGEPTVVAGRRCTQLTARERTEVAGDVRYDLVAEPFGMVSGGQDFILDVDDATGVIVRATKLVEGQVAEIMEWTELSLDRLLDAGLFAPLG